MRHRAERLIEVFNKLKVNQSTSADVQAFLSPWKAQIPSWQSCTEKSCVVNFSINSHIFDMLLRFRFLEILRIPILRSYQLLSGHPAAIAIWVRIYQGKLVSKTLHTYLESPPVNGEEQILTGEVSADVGLTDWPNNADLVMPQLALHSDYVVGSATFRFNADFSPSGGAPTIWVQSLANADNTVIEPLTNFNLGCFTQWHSCSTQADLMPEAWSQYLRDKTQLKSGTINYQCMPSDLERTARDADNVAIIKITAAHKESTNDAPDSLFITMELVKRLKHVRSFWRNVVTEPNVQVLAVPMAPIPDLPNGDRYILLFAPGIRRQMLLYPCGIVPLNDRNLEIVNRGVSADEYPEPPSTF